MDDVNEGDRNQAEGPQGTGAPAGPVEPTQPHWWPGAIGATTPPEGGGAAPTGEPTGQWPAGWDQPAARWAPPREPARPTRSPAVPIALILAALVLIAAGVVIGHGLWTRTVGSARPIPSTQPTTPQSPSENPGSSGPTNAGAIASQVDPGLVDINTTLSYQQAEGAGTGMVLTPSGEVLTNNHVIEGATNISVTDIGNGRTYGATVVGYDVTRDLAIIQLQGASNLKTVSTGDSSQLSVGDKVVGVGNAQGRGGTPSYAGGTVTALNQTITASDALDGSRQLSGLIESSTYIQPGDSGGPVVNQDGQVVAMDTAAAAGFAGFQSGGSPSYSIPINEAITVSKQIEAGRSSSTVHIGATAFLGVQISASNSPGVGSGIGGFSPQTPPTNGVVVAAVLSGEPAEQAGMVAGDVIIKVGNVSVDSPSALTDALLAYHPGGKVQIYWTDTSGQAQSAIVQLASGPPQ